jgi:hypothetical protein
MKRCVAIGMLAVFLSGRAAPAQSTELPPPPSGPAEAVPPADSVAGGDGAWQRFYGDAEYLLWWMRGTALPPLVTSSPQGTPIGQAGVLGAPGTVVLFGQSTVNDDVRSGMRFTIGGWVDCGHLLGVEGNFLLLEGKTARFAASSNGSPILGRPFTDATTGQQDAQRVAFPGDVSGSVDVSATTDGLIGAGVLVRRNLCCGCDSRLDLLAGYRHLRFADRLAVDEELTSVNPNNPNFILPGTQIRVADAFDAKNDFNGFDLGFDARFGRGPWGADLLVKLAVGPNTQTVDIAGATTFIVPGTPPVTRTGGLLALDSNIGHHSRTEISVVPELDFNVGYRFTPHLRATVGYSLLYWSDVVRVGDQIDLAVNPNLLPNSTTAATGPQRPAFDFHRTYFLAQGITFGLEYGF